MRKAKIYGHSLLALTGLAVFGSSLAGAASDGTAGKPPLSAALPAGEGRDLVVNVCSACHSLGLAVGERRTANEWRELINRMVEFGAPLDDAGVKVAYGYLSTHLTGEGGAKTEEGPASRTTTHRFNRPSGINQWPAYGGGGANRNYSELTEIEPDNVKGLQRAWTYHYGAGSSTSGDEGMDFRWEITPLLIGGVLYFSTPRSRRAPDQNASITAIRPETGELIWKYESRLNIHGRGIAYWPGDGETAPRIFFATDQGYLRAVDVTTGQLAPGFGRDGSIDAYIGVASEIVGESRRDSWSIPNPVTVYRNLIITGARPGEFGSPQPRGDIRAWDARTGRLVWTFHTVPQQGEANHDRYTGDQWRDISGANVWSTMALDEENGILFAPTGDLNSEADGSQPYSSSILALDATTGSLLWYRQITHRDLFDYDLPTPPVLFDAERDGKQVPAILVTGKHGLVFLFNRLTGEPLNGYSERPVERGDLALSGSLWPTQPFPDAPGSINRNGMMRGEIPDLAPGMKKACETYWDEHAIESVGVYSPRQSTQHGTISYPGMNGGPNWGGGAFAPDLGYYFINIQNTPVFRSKVAGQGSVSTFDRDQMIPTVPGHPFSFRLPSGEYASCGATPWGELVAVDVRRHAIAWRVPLGSVPELGAMGKGSGSKNLGGSIVTRSGIVFIGATPDRKFRAFDARTGSVLWEADLPAGAHATPITYMGKDGKQYVVIAAGGGTYIGGPEMSDALVAFRLP